MALYKTYYVSKLNGLDTNPGTSESKAWKTLAKVNSFPFTPGSTIKLRNGDTWFEKLEPTASGEYRKPIRFTSWSGWNNKPIITGGLRFQLWTAEVVGGFTAYWSPATIPVFACTDNRVRMKRVLSKAALVVRSFYYDVAAARLYIRASWDENPFPLHNIEAAQRNEVVNFLNPYLEIQYVETRVSNGDGIALRGVGCAADDCGAGECYKAGLGVYSSDCRSHAGFYSGNNANIWIEGVPGAHITGFVSEDDSSFESWADTPGTDGLGFYANCMDDARIDHLHVRLSGFHAVTLEASNGNTFTSLEAEVYDGSGIRLLNHANTNRFRWTLLSNGFSRYGNGWCVEIDASEGNIFDYVMMLGQETDESIVTAGTANIVRLNGPEAEYNKFNNCVLLGFYGTERGFTFEGANPAGRGTVIKNCIYQGISHAMFFNYASSPASAAIDIDFNDWYRIGSSNIILWNATEYTLTTWRALTVHDDNSFAVDPKFVDAQGGDVRINGNSPCRNEGTNLNYERDYYGNPVPVGGAPDIGVHEYPSGVTTPPYLSNEKEP